MNSSTELLHGTLDTLVLKTLIGRRHTDSVVTIEDGSLYPAL